MYADGLVSKEEFKRILEEQRIHPLARDSWSDSTGVNHISSFDYPELLELLLALGGAVDDMDPHGRPSLHKAIEAKRLENVKILLAYGADPLIKNRKGKTIVPNASMHAEMVAVLKNPETAVTKYRSRTWEQILFDFRRTVTEENKGLRVSNSPHFELVKFFISEGVDVNHTWVNGQSPIHAAASRGRLDITKFLASNGADLAKVAPKTGARYANEKNWNLLHFAAEYDKADVVKFLVEQGVDVHWRADDGSTPLGLAVKNGSIKSARVLVEGGADVNSKRTLHNTPVLFRVTNKSKPDVALELAKLLVKNGADVNAVDYFDYTALHKASQIPHLAVAEYLIKQGADINAKSKSNQTPLAAATEKNNKKLVELLRAKGGH